VTCWVNPNARIRPLDTLSRAALRDGVARSPTLRGLVARLDEGGTIVHVESGYAASQRDDAHLQCVSVSGGQRYLRISINLIKDRHRLYERLGRTRQGRTSSFETVGAEAVSARLFNELGGASPGASGKPTQCDQ
jgi:hypothetical protein